MNTPLTAERTFRKLEAYCRSRDWAGFDPYDALNSELFARTPLAKSRIARIAFTQLMKRSPLDLRPQLRIRSQRDPKATALFISAYVNATRVIPAIDRQMTAKLVGRLLELRSPGVAYSCWGYSFPWQTRERLVPRFSPNLVTTVFAANALLDAYESGCGQHCVEAAATAGDYIVRELYWSDRKKAGLAYPLPDVRVPIHNANLLGAALLCRLAHLTGERQAVATALRVTEYSVSQQREDGSWTYGDGRNQQWVDNFHTGYNLCALRAIQKHLNTDDFERALSKGLAFYREHLFTADGIPKYFSDQLYPIDIHCVAQSLVTFTTLRDLDPRLDAAAEAVLAWAMDHLWDERGFFYYRVLRALTIRTPYMRWSQAWMLLALSHLVTCWSVQPQQSVAECLVLSDVASLD